MTLNSAVIGKDYKVKGIDSIDTEMRDFLFTLGLYPGEKINVISRLASNFVIHIKNSRYSMDDILTSAILVEEVSAEDDERLKEKVS